MLQRGEVVAGDIQQAILVRLQVMHGGLHGAPASAIDGIAKHGHLIDEGNAILAGGLKRVGELFLRQLRNCQRRHRPRREFAEHFLLKMRHERGGISFLHFHEADNDRLARLQEHAQELRGHFIVIALIGSDIYDHIRQGSTTSSKRGT